MMPCAVTTGFFVLRRCGRRAVAGCPRCGRPLCQSHVADHGLCPECAAALDDATHPAARRARHRRSFRSHSSRTFTDTDLYTELDTFDRAPFEPGAAGSEDYADDGGDSMMDS